MKVTFTRYSMFMNLNEGMNYEIHQFSQDWHDILYVYEIYEWLDFVVQYQIHGWCDKLRTYGHSFYFYS